MPETALCSALAEFFTWVTAGSTAAAAVTERCPFADLIAFSRPDSEFCSAVVCDGYADFASVANDFRVGLDAGQRGLQGAEAVLGDVDVAEVADGGLEVGGVGAVGGLAAAAPGGQPGQDQHSG